MLPNRREGAKNVGRFKNNIYCSYDTEIPYKYLKLLLFSNIFLPSYPYFISIWTEMAEFKLKEYLKLINKNPENTSTISVSF